MFLWKLPQLIQSTSSHRSKILIVISRAQSSVSDLLTIKEDHSYKHFQLGRSSLKRCPFSVGIIQALLSPPPPPGEGQNCKGQKCTKHELVLLMFFVLKRLDDLLWGSKMPLVGLLWLLVHHQINSGSNKLLMEVVKSAQSTSSCFCFNSYVGWPKSLLEL